jgi:hypothetical protein
MGYLQTGGDWTASDGRDYMVGLMRWSAGLFSSIALSGWDGLVDNLKIFRSGHNVKNTLKASPLLQRPPDSQTREFPSIYSIHSGNLW